MTRRCGQPARAPAVQIPSQPHQVSTVARAMGQLLIFLDTRRSGMITMRAKRTEKPGHLAKPSVMTLSGRISVSEALAVIGRPDPALARGLIAELGLEPIIHCGGTKTGMGGSRTHPRVRDVMWSASDVFVPIAELNEAVGSYMASVTGAESALVTSGAASGNLLSMAACMTGLDRARIARIPDTADMPNELIIMRTHIGRHSHLYRRAGARIVEVGNMSECQLWEILSAISERTAAIAWLEGPGIRQVGPSLATVCLEAHRLGKPVIVDAAAMLPPRSNLRRYISDGADLVVFSGGKVIRGPQNTGILAGRSDLVAAAAANNSPNHAIGRPCKVSREDLIGLYVALKHYVEVADEAAEIAAWRKLLESVLAELSGTKIAATIEREPFLFHVPTLVIPEVSQRWGRAPSEVSAALLAGHPRVFVPSDDSRDQLTVNPISLLPSEVPAVAARLIAEFSSARPVRQQPATVES
jgi:D-glucosaminate-6-phosphate ammonia-lyase